jgi:uncharacterized protein (TIGR02145 family)
MKINHWVIFDSILFFLLNLFILPIHSQMIKLDEAKFRNGDKLLFCSSDSQWLKANENRQPAYRVDRLGNKLYNWYAISDKRIIAPKGYHIPTRVDFTNQKSSKDFDCDIDYIAKTYNCELLYYNSTSEVRNDKSLHFWTAEEANNCNAFLAQRKCDYSINDRKSIISSDIIVGRKYLGCYVLLFKGEQASYQTEVNDKFKVGSQLWMKSNLDVEHFRNGDKIVESKTFEDWKKNSETHTPTWCYYNFDSLNKFRYGKIYNIWSIRDSRNLAPMGWSIPSDSDFKMLFNEYKEDKYNTVNLYSDCYWKPNNIVNKWISGNWYSSNNAWILPGGSLICEFEYNVRKKDNDSLYMFQGEGDTASLWTISHGSSRYGRGRSVSIIPRLKEEIFFEDVSSCNGYYIRCIKGESENIVHLNQIHSTNAIDLKDDQNYETWEDELTGKIWMKYNLNISKFRNGDNIFQAKNEEEWKSAIKNEVPAWCYYNFIEPLSREYLKQFGKLYNYYVVIDKRNIAPVGWKIPSSLNTSNEIVYLKNFSARKYKAKKYWRKYNFDDSFFENLFGKYSPNGFNMLPTGCFDGNTFNYFQERSFLWIMNYTNHESNPEIYELKYDRNFGYTYKIYDPIDELNNKNQFPSLDSTSPTDLGGYSIRCVKE